MNDQQKQGALGEENAVIAAARDGETLTAVTKKQNLEGTDFTNQDGHMIDVKTYGYLLLMQYNHEKNWCSIPHPFNIRSNSTHIYTTWGTNLTRYTKPDYFKQFFKEGTNIDSLRKLAKNYEGRCSEDEYLKRKQILETILRNFIKDEYRFDTSSKDRKWNKLKVIC